MTAAGWVLSVLIGLTAGAAFTACRSAARAVAAERSAQWARRRAQGYLEATERLAASGSPERSAGVPPLTPEEFAVIRARLDAVTTRGAVLTSNPDGSMFRDVLQFARDLVTRLEGRRPVTGDITYPCPNLVFADGDVAVDRSAAVTYRRPDLPPPSDPANPYRVVRERDGDVCRFCGRIVRFGARRGIAAGRFVHVDPADPQSLVVACAECAARPAAERRASVSVGARCLRLQDAVAQQVEAGDRDGLVPHREVGPASRALDVGGAARGGEPDRDARAERELDGVLEPVEQADVEALAAADGGAVRELQGQQDVVVDLVLGAGVEQGPHQTSPSVGRSSVGAGPVGGALGVGAPGAGDPTVGAPTDSVEGPSASTAAVEDPAGGGEASAPPSAEAPAFGRVDGPTIPDGIAAAWVCPCGAAGYVLPDASPADVAGYEEDAAAHAEHCPESGAL